MGNSQEALEVQCPRCGARPGVMCGNRDKAHPVRRGAALSGLPAPGERSGPLPVPAPALSAPWERGATDNGLVDAPDGPGPGELHAGALGGDEHEIMCCVVLRREDGCPVCDRACWLCEARAGRACRRLPGARRLARVAHVARLWKLGWEEQQQYRDAMTRLCPHCHAQPGRLCRSVPRTGTDARARLAEHPHRQRR